MLCDQLVVLISHKNYNQDARKSYVINLRVINLQEVLELITFKLQEPRNISKPTNQSIILILMTIVTSTKRL